MRIVFDTNILVSALVFPGGRGEAALLRIVEERDQLFLSKPILDELLGILARKFARDAEELARTAIFISALGTTVRPRRKLRVVKDEPDNRLLECAVAGRADAIVTGDRALVTREFRGVRILSLREYLETAWSAKSERGLGLSRHAGTGKRTADEVVASFT
ncbi:MAG TPA: putative toxin-antitoxin system toxin component, PIN family [Burkholderiales bacterium]|nr:putative toxin-antitoxin system toxin component, PIN family [Burkholderiales bacterium]